jgi:hypothetical protein
MISKLSVLLALLALIMPTRNQSITPRWLSLPMSLLVGLVLGLGLLHNANGQAANATADEFGVRHAITAAIELDRDAPFAKANGGELKATMRISVRILDYASDSRFYGVVEGNFSEFDPRKGAAAKEIWADQKCHRNRGLPRIWVLTISERIAQAGTISDISARPRHIGQRLPSDEIVIQSVPKMDASDSTSNLVVRAKPKHSWLGVELILKSTVCRLNQN